ncbi:MAG TPA: hypothetical protein VGI19_14700 [Candidatus Cybelea sp.]
MRSILLVTVLAAAALLAGCTAGNIQGNSFLPNASHAVHVHHYSDSVGGGPPEKHDGILQQKTDSVGGGPPAKHRRVNQDSGDSVGGGPPDDH